MRQRSHQRRRRPSAVVGALVLVPILLVAVPAFAPVAAGSVGTSRGAWRLVDNPLVTRYVGSTLTLLAGPACAGPAPRSFCGRVLLAGGKAGQGASAESEIYDPATHAWTATAPMGTARSGHTATLLADGRVLVTGGQDLGGAAVESSELYDPAANAGGGAWTPAPPMGNARSNHTATLLVDGRVLVAGGRVSGCAPLVGCGPRAVSSSEIYDPTGDGSWAVTASLASARSNHTATLLSDGKVLLSGGAAVSFLGEQSLSSVEVYDPGAPQGAEEWSAGPELGTARAGHTATLLGDGKVLVAGGHGLDLALDSAEVFDPVGGDGSDAWSPASSMPTTRSGHTATVLEGPACQMVSPAAWCGMVLLAGGHDAQGQGHRTGDLFEPGSGQWQSTLPAVGPFDSPGAVLLADGTVLTVAVTAQLFDPALTTQPPSVASITPTTASARGGTTVTIRGGGFRDATVLFGDTAALSTKLEDAAADDSTGTLTAVSPAHAAGEVDVTVTTPAGTSFVTSRARFTYVPNSWRPTGPMFNVRARHAAAVLDGTPCRVAAAPPWCGRVIATGGFATMQSSDASEELRGSHAATEVYDPRTGKWAAGPPMKLARSLHTATILADGRVLVTGGIGGDGTKLASAEIYDPAAVGGAWIALADMSAPRSGHTATLLGDGQRVLVTGGAGPLATAEVLDPGAASGQGTWAQTGPMRKAVINQTATLLPSGNVLVAGGTEISQTGPLEGVPTHSTEIYDPIRGEWYPGPDMEFTRSRHTATLLRDGKVLVVGGNTSPKVEVFDPSANSGAGSWSATGGSLNDSRSDHSATLLPDGRVLVAGGLGAGSVLATTEIYDPSRTAWDRASPLDDCGRPSCVTRHRHSATALPDGSVLVAGGRTSQGSASNSTNALTDTAEIFEIVAGEPKPRVDALDPPVGSTFGSNEVTIRGRALFSSSTSVHFGDEPAKVTSVADQTVTVRAPARAQGTVDVTVTTPAGNSSPSFTSKYTYGPGSWAATGALDGCSPAASSCQGRAQHTATVLDGPACRGPSTPSWCGQVLVVGGGRLTPPIDSVLSPSPTTQVYDPPSGRWLPAPALDSCAGTATGGSGACIAREAHTAALLDPSFCQSPDPPAGYPCGQVLIAGGRSVPPEPHLELESATAELYDPAAGTAGGGWRPAASMLNARARHMATVLDGPACVHASRPAWCGRVLVVGASEGPILPSELYDPVNDTWEAGPSPRYEHDLGTVTALGDGRILLIGGRRTGSYANPGGPGARSAEVFDPAADGGRGAWSESASMVSERYAHSATLLDGSRCGTKCGQVLVVGGIGRSSPQPELYDPATGQWSAADLPHDARAAHTATALPDGKVLIAGGGDLHRLSSEASGFADYDGFPLFPGQLASAEVFDPADGPLGRWTRTSWLATARDGHTASVLGGPRCRSGGPGGPPPYCGTVLVAGGSRATGDVYKDAPEALVSAEAYTPAPEPQSVEPATGPSRGGDSVVIRGVGFASAAAVHFGDAEVGTGDFSVDSPTQLTVHRSPPHPTGEVEVAVTNPGGISLHDPPLVTNPLYTYAISQTPGGVNDLTAQAKSTSEIGLSFSAPSADGGFPPPAGSYLVRQSPSPIAGPAEFASAQTLCEGDCSFVPAGVGDTLSLSVSGLAPGTTYHYALQARNDAGMLGPLSNAASATTTGAASVGPVAGPVAGPVVATPDPPGTPGVGPGPPSEEPGIAEPEVPALPGTRSPGPVPRGSGASVIATPPSSTVPVDTTPAPVRSADDSALASPTRHSSSSGLPWWLMAFFALTGGIGAILAGAYLNKRFLGSFNASGR